MQAAAKESGNGAFDDSARLVWTGPNPLHHHNVNDSIKH